MADERKIVIELKVNNLSSETSAAKGENSEDNLTDLLKDMQHPIASLEKATLGKNVLAYNFYQNGKQLLKSGTLYYAQKYFNLTENYKMQTDLSNTLSIIEHISSIGASIAGGALTGAKLGPIGAAVGAVIGAGTAIGNNIISATKAWENQSISLHQANMQSSFQQVRLGLVDDGRGTLN